MRKNITNSSWAEIQWIYKCGQVDIVPGQCLLFIDLSNVNYKNTCNNKHRYNNDIYVIVRSLQNRSLNNNGKLAQSCKFAERVYMVSVNVIHNTCFVISDIGNEVDKNIVHYINHRSRWVGNI